MSEEHLTLIITGFSCGFLVGSNDPCCRSSWKHAPAGPRGFRARIWGHNMTGCVSLTWGREVEDWLE